MSKDIEELIKECTTCQMHQRENIKEPIGSRPIPNYPFEIVASDLFYKESDYIVLADNYFGFIKFKKLYSTTTYEVIEFFKKSFLTHGIPKLFETDNRPVPIKRI
ncbi:hypothetical protein RF55_13271 [Lasius niger]|uniref:Uncharacterized protein n=1 Tax=Lasius niger TaxID=67767 RepID=A0A0J7KAK7_LASNI|nr:hypothetical protein RF55_13271 [Lasius niger]